MADGVIHRCTKQPMERHGIISALQENIMDLFLRIIS